jgi:hypothetical protein
VRSAPNAEPAPPSCCRPPTPKLCSFTSMRPQPKSLRALTLFSSSIKPAGMAPRPSRFQATSHSCSSRHAPTRPRKYLAIHAAELAVEPHFSILRRHRRSLLLRLEHAHRSGVENHVHRPPRLGSRRSLNLRIGIIPKLADPDSCRVRPSETSNCRNVRRYNGISAPCSRADDGAHESTSPQAGISPLSPKFRGNG